MNLLPQVIFRAGKTELYGNIERPQALIGNSRPPNPKCQAQSLSSAGLQHKRLRRRILRALVFQLLF
jgi:hypothetical protein